MSAEREGQLLKQERAKAAKDKVDREKSRQEEADRIVDAVVNIPTSSVHQVTPDVHLKRDGGGAHLYIRSDFLNGNSAIMVRSSDILMLGLVLTKLGRTLEEQHEKLVSAEREKSIKLQVAEELASGGQASRDLRGPENQIV